MQNYQLVLVLKSGLKKEEKDKMISTVLSWAKDAKSTKIDALGDKKFSYSIKKEAKGDYTVVYFTASNLTSDFQKRIVNQEGILRHLLIKN